jgi:hypothetical protein
MWFCAQRHSSLQNLQLTEELKSEIEITELALQRAVVMTDDEARRLNNTSQEIAETSSIDTRIDGETYAELVKRLEDDRKAAEATKTMLMDLVSKLSRATAEGVGATSQDHSSQSTSGNHDSGLQSRVIKGGVHGAHFGG